MTRALLILVLWCLAALPSLAAPPKVDHLSALESFSLDGAGNADALLATRLLLWPQLENAHDGIFLHVPGDEPRRIYTTEPLYQIGKIYGVAEGDWAVFSETPANAGTPKPDRMVAIFIPRGTVTKWELPGPLDDRYAYAPRLFGFPSRDGAVFHWLSLPYGGTAGFGTISPARSIKSLSVDGDMLVAKTIDPKNFNGSDALVYYWYGLAKGADGLFAVSQFEARSFPTTGSQSYNAEEIYFHPQYTVLSGESRASGANAITIAPVAGGTGKVLPGRLLDFHGGRLMMLREDNTLALVQIGAKVGGAETQGAKADDPGDAVATRTLWELPLAQAGNVGEIVWIRGAAIRGTLAILEVDLHLPGRTYRGEHLGSPALIAWDWVAKKRLYQLVGVTEQ